MMGSGGMRTKRYAVPQYELAGPAASFKQRIISRSIFALQIVLFLASLASFIMLYRSFAWATAVSCINAAAVSVGTQQGTSTVPDYFQTTPMLFPGKM